MVGEGFRSEAWSGSGGEGGTEGLSRVLNASCLEVCISETTSFVFSRIFSGLVGVSLRGKIHAMVSDVFFCVNFFAAAAKQTIPRRILSHTS